MSRLKLFFAIIFGLSFFPAWRFLDNVAFLSPYPKVYTLCFFCCFYLFVAIPLFLTFPKVKRLGIFFVILCLTFLSWYVGPISGMATNDSEHSHCGHTTYTGFFYPAKSILSSAFQDDLDARNQLCWIRKMVSRIPDKFESGEDFENYLKLVDQKLLTPKHKYRSTLPLIAVLNFVITTRWDISNNPVTKIQSGAIFLDKLNFWSGQYTTEISTRNYSLWDWPMGPYIKFEYGLIEKNWERILKFFYVQKV